MFKRFIIIAMTVVLVIVLLAIISNTILNIYSSAVSGGRNHQLYFFGYKPVIVITGSMEPAIKTNSVSIVKKCSIEDIKVGDIIMYRSANNMLVTHRVLQFTDMNGVKGVITKGDSNKLPDGNPATADNILAKVVYTFNSMAPIVSEIMPEPGIVNTLAIIRGILIVILTGTLMWITAKNIINASMSICSIILGDKRYDKMLYQYEQDINSNVDISIVLKESRHRKETDFKLIDKIILGLHRANIRDNLKEIQRETKGLTKKIIKYRNDYEKAIKSTEEKENKTV